MKRLINCNVIFVLLLSCGLQYSEEEKGPHFFKYASHPVDQVFRDYNGYMVIWEDEKNIFKELEYRHSSCSKCTNNRFSELPKDIPLKIKSKFIIFEKDNIFHSPGVKIIGDLNSDSRGYADVLTTKVYSGMNMSFQYYTNVVIHLPQRSKIIPGLYRFGHPAQRQTGYMYEIKGE